jgi:hypothetical protein
MKSDILLNMKTMKKGSFVASPEFMSSVTKKIE